MYHRVVLVSNDSLIEILGLIVQVLLLVSTVYGWWKVTKLNEKSQKNLISEERALKVFEEIWGAKNMARQTTIEIREPINKCLRALSHGGYISCNNRDDLNIRKDSPEFILARDVLNNQMRELEMQFSDFVELLKLRSYAFHGTTDGGPVEEDMENLLKAVHDQHNSFNEAIDGHTMSRHLLELQYSIFILGTETIDNTVRKVHDQTIKHYYK